MKIAIWYEFVDGPWGGANQFLKALRDQWQTDGVLTNNLDDADVVVVNLNPSVDLRGLHALKRRRPQVALLMRIDGPVWNIRGCDRALDALLIDAIHQLGSGVVFQSQWSQQRLLALGLIPPTVAQVIPNAPDPKLFYRDATHVRGDRLCLVASSWSNNPRKGFATYQWLDQHLDWSKYVMTFVGNSPVSFKHIQVVPPQASVSLGDILRRHDVYITASERDPCSNALIEALHCGLPALALRDGGHPELIGNGGFTFADRLEVPTLLERIAADWDGRRAAISLPGMPNVAASYLQACVEAASAERAAPHRAKPWHPLLRMWRGAQLKVERLGHRLRLRRDS